MTFTNSCIRYLVLLLFLFTGKPAVNGQNNESIRDILPYAVIDKGEIDLGKIEQGSRSTGEIRIRNEGAKEFLIARVRSSCGLMIPTWPDRATGPGEEVVVSFRYDTSRPGPFERKVVIHTNSYQRTLVVTVKGEVITGKRNKNI